MITKTSIQRYFSLLLAVMLVACQPETIGEVPTSTPVVSVTQTLEVPSPTSPPKFPLDGYVITFVKDGDLYFQDENNPPIQLTHSEQEHSPIILSDRKNISPVISDDNKYIVFYRGNDLTKIHIVNTERGEERDLLSGEWLALQGKDVKIRFPTFLPNEHQLIFNTYQCETEDYRSPCLIGLYLIDIDTSVIIEILSPKNFEQYNHDGNFKISPDGKLVSVVMSGHIEIFDMKGQVIRQNVLPYTPSTPAELFPVQYWLPDSDGLVVAIPDEINFGWAYDYHPTYAVWRYEIEKNAGVQVPLNPSPSMFFFDCGEIISVSPDANWILYDNWDESLQTGVFYVSNLNEPHSQEISGTCMRNSAYPWSPDSKYFIYGSPLLQSPEGMSSPLDSNAFTTWLDADHFIYFTSGNGGPLVRVGEIDSDEVYSYDILLPFAFIKPK